MDCQFCGETVNINVSYCENCGGFYREETYDEKYGRFIKARKTRRIPKMTKMMWGKCGVCGGAAHSRHHIFYKRYFPKLEHHRNNIIKLCRKCHEEIHFSSVRIRNDSSRFDLKFLLDCHNIQSLSS